MQVRSLAILAACGAAACGTPVPVLTFELNESNEQACPSAECSSVKLPCPTVIHIQIFAPNDPGHPFLDQCTPVNRDISNDICTLASVELDAVPIPVRHLEVQVELYAAASLSRNADESFACPHVPFAGTGFPIEATSLDPGVPSPAVGGVGWYNPGDTNVTVKLGCTNLAAMNACMSKNLITVNANVFDFQSSTLVLQGTPDVKALDLSIGEPRGVDGRSAFNVEDLKQITVEPGIPDGAATTWGGPVDVPLRRFACVNVLETAAQATASVTCVAKSDDVDTIDIRGVWLKRKQLTAILAALGPMPFPDDGITIGMVLNDSGLPVRGQAVRGENARIQYLTEDGAGGYTATDKPTVDSTIFVSTDAPFPTDFTAAQGPGKPTLLQFGGKIAGRVTMVLLGTHAALAASATSTLP